jgi:hypothetical protein
MISVLFQFAIVCICFNEKNICFLDYTEMKNICFHRIGAMNSRTYFSNLMATAFNYHSACGDKHPDVIRPIEASDEPIAVEDDNGVAKEKRRTKNFNVDEDKLLMST